MAGMRSVGRLAVAASMCAALLLLFCSGPGAAAALRSNTAPGPGGTRLPDFPPSMDFYRLPSHVRPEPPGTLTRVQTVSVANGSTTLRVMYHSRNASGRDVLVTGMVTYPTTRPPSGGWPVISWDHGTSGLSQSCAPSRSGGTAPDFGVRAVSVATDYLGLGPDGDIHPYLDRVDEANSTIDIVRAARQIPDAHASTTWFAVGDSQGGHASLSAGEIAPSYAPELRLVGTVAIAPGALLSKMFPGDSKEVYDIIEVMALYGAQAADPRDNPDEVLAPAARGVASVVETGCVGEITGYLAGVYAKTGGHLFTRAPLSTPQGRAWAKANDVPQVRTASPMLVVAGGQDTVVVPARINALMTRLCSLGDHVSVDWYPQGNHSTEPALASSRIEAWIEARLRGRSVPTSCPYEAPPLGSR
jgi:dienelactone hydrolase